MWKNIFIEACVLSLLVFGGFYINATFLKEKITASEEKVLDHTLSRNSRVHVSGVVSDPSPTKPPVQHLSGGPSTGKENRPPVGDKKKPVPLLGK